MDIKLLSGALGAEISGIDLKDSSKENYEKINNLLLEHKVLFFRNQDITPEAQIALADNWGPLSHHAYVQGLDKHPELIRIINTKEATHPCGDTWHTAVCLFSPSPSPRAVLLSRLPSSA